MSEFATGIIVGIAIGLGAFVVIVGGLILAAIVAVRWMDSSQWSDEL